MPNRSKIERLVLEAIAWCLPAGCLACGAPLPAIAPLSLCPRCRRNLCSSGRQSCATCGREMAGDGLHRCERCRESPPAFDRLSSLWSYDDLSRPVILGLKFGGLRYLGRHIAEAMVERYREEIQRADALAAVPLHPWRYLTRGFNQAAEIAAPLARLSGKPHLEMLRRTRATRPQRGLDRTARRRNLAGAFRARSGASIPSRVLLIDDVATTGSTLDAAAGALKAAGAARVVALTAAQTPLPRESPDPT